MANILIRRLRILTSQFGAQEWLMKRAVFVGMFPSIMLASLVQKRYFPRFSLICLAVAGRPRYSITNESLGMRSWVKRPLPLCDRKTVSRKGAGTIRAHRGLLFRHPHGEHIRIHTQPRLLPQFGRRLFLHPKGKSMPAARLAWSSRRPMSAYGMDNQEYQHGIFQAPAHLCYAVCRITELEVFWGYDA